jgi:hypothetical protein
MGFELNGELTLLDLVLVAQEFTRSEQETVAVVRELLESGRVRLRASPARRERPPATRPRPVVQEVS